MATLASIQFDSKNQASLDALFAIKSQSDIQGQKVTNLLIEFITEQALFDNLASFNLLNLTDITIRSCSLNGALLTSIGTIPHLRSFHFESCWRISAKEWLDFLVKINFKEVVSLSLSATSIDDECLRVLACKPNQIKELNLSFCHSITDKGLVQVIQSEQFVKVNQLLIRCLHLTDVTLNALSLSNLHKTLKKLNLQQCLNCSSNGLQQLMASNILEGLEYLDVSSTLFDNDSLSILSAREECALKIFKSFECSNLCDPGVRALFSSKLISQLEGLDLSWVHFKNSTFEILIGKQLRLNELNIPMILSLQAETLKRVMKESSLLEVIEVLDLSFNQVDDSLVEDILKMKREKKTKLRELAVFSCRLVTPRIEMRRKGNEVGILVKV